MKGEIISLIVAVSWTITALCAEYASKHIGQLATNVIRMAASLVLLSLTMLVFTGSPLPLYADGKAWFWLSMSGFVGYCFGDYCLFNSYIVMGSRFGQLFMTLAPPVAAIASWMIFGETMTPLAMLGMIVTMFGIALSIFGKEENAEESTSLPKRKQIGYAELKVLHSSLFTVISHPLDELKVHSKIPLRGILFGIGAGTGQGLGLVLSKLGMTYYQANIPATEETVLNLMPFTSTFIRAITGMAGFVLVMLVTKQTRTVLQATRDHRSMLVMAGAVIFGPFIGVSLSLMATLYTNPGIAQTIMAITPVLILWPSYLLYKQKVTIREVIGAVISVVGVSLFFV